MTESAIQDRHPALIELRGITKSFGATRALRHVSFAARGGRVHALVGENGAGKSTLLKIMGGIVEPDAGGIIVDGVETKLGQPADAQRLGIQIVHQELALLGQLSVADNVFVGAPRTNRGGLLRRREMDAAAGAALARLGSDIDVRRRVDGLSTAQQQFVEVARGLTRSSRVLILDEPTAALSPADADRLLALLRDLAAAGIAVIYVSHRLSEVLAVADEVTILKDGQVITTLPATELDVPRMVRLMVGRDLAAMFPDRVVPPARAQRPLLEVRGLIAPPRVWGVDLTVQPGEIVGVYGLEGNGQNAILACLAGAIRPTAGVIRVGGKRLPAGGVRTAIRHGIGYVPPDRKGEGLLLADSGIRNITLPVLRRRFSRGTVVDAHAESRTATAAAKTATMRGDVHTAVASLSGGNQQKVLLARLLAADAKVLLLDQPTRGVDVGAKSEIYEVIRGICDRGAAAVVVSPEIQELLGLCDRILVVRAGWVVGEVPATNADEEGVLAMAVAP